MLLLSGHPKLICFYPCTFYCYVQYGRSGKAKPKIVKYVPSTKTIEWEASGSDRMAVIRSLFRRSSFSVHSEPLGVEEGKPSSISLESIRSVCCGVQTDVLLKAGLVDPACCVSIVTESRTLDLTLANVTERDRVVRGLKILLEGKPVPFL